MVVRSLRRITLLLVVSLFVELLGFPTQEVSAEPLSDEDQIKLVIADYFTIMHDSRETLSLGEFGV